MLLVHRGQGEGESEVNARWTNVGFASGAIGLHECSASRPQSGHCCACIGVAICGGPNLPLCAPLQPASPVLAVICATVRADIAMAVMLGLRLTDVVLGRERERLRRCRNGGAASDCAFAVANGVGTGTEPASFANRPIQPSRSNPPQPRGRRAPARSAASANRLSR